MKQIVISGYYGFNNAGDEAILDSIVDTLRSLAQKRGETLSFTVLSANPAVTTARLQVNAVYRMDFLAIFHAIRKSDAFISGGGGLLQDATGRGFSIPYYLGLVLLARLLGKKTIFYAQGIGPISKKFNQLLTRVVANRASLLSVRDHGSVEELRRLGVTRPPLTLTVDPVFLLEPADPQGRAAAFVDTLPENSPVVGIAVRSWKKEEETLREIAAAADTLAHNLAAVTVLVPMHYPEDLLVSEKLAALMKSDTVILRDNLNPREFLSVFNHFNLVVAMRLHALIFAAVSGIPMLGIGYDRKVDAFLARLGLDSSGEPGTVVSAHLAGQALKLWETRDESRKFITEKSNKFRDDARQWADHVLDFILQ